jgi:hypothetical protein
MADEDESSATIATSPGPAVLQDLYLHYGLSP